MRKYILIALGASALVTAAAAEARDGCGPRGHVDRWGHCRPNVRPYGGVVIAPSLIIGRLYDGRGYWDGHRYWQNWDGHRGWQNGDRRFERREDHRDHRGWRR